MKRYIAAVAVVAACGLSACGAEKPAAVVNKDSKAKVVSSGSPSAEASKAPKTTPVGTTVQVGDWQVQVTGVNLNGNDAVHKANEFNDKPKGQYVLVDYTATYTGDSRDADINSDLTWTFTGSDQQVNDEAEAVTPAETDNWPTAARKGGAVKGEAIFDIAPALQQGGLVSVETYDADYDKVYADFTLS